MPSHPSESTIVQAQLESLDDTDCYASVWEDILSQQRVQSSSTSKHIWGGRGKGGRGLSRRTVQPYDVIVDDVRLQYLFGDICLEGATLKLLQGHKYALCGKNGCGKSTLLQRMHAQKIPGWSTQWSSLYIPPELPSEYLPKTPVEVVLAYQSGLAKHTHMAIEARMDDVQVQLDALDMEQEVEEMERLCEELSMLEEHLDVDTAALQQSALEALDEMGVDATVSSCHELSRGMQKRVLLSVALTLGPVANLLLLDEPSAHLDVFGLIQLRRLLLESYPTTVVLVSHDVDFVNDAATDIIEMKDQKLWYFPGNYDNYCLLKEQQGMHGLRQSAIMEKKRGQILTTIQHLKEKPVPKRGGAKKKAKAVASQRKKLDRHSQLEKANSDVTASTSSIIPAKKGLTAQQKLKLADSLKRVPDKAVQFRFPTTLSTWGEPLITALEVGHSYNEGAVESNSDTQENEEDGFRIEKKDGYLFDCVDLCIGEGSRNCILGPTACGKSTLLQLLSRRIVPLDGTVHHASGIRVGYLDDSVIQQLVAVLDTDTTALDFLTSRYSQKTEQELRGHLTSFGLSPITQAKTPMVYLSSGEKFRAVLAMVMFESPPVLCLDDPTLYLDVESVQALVYGLNQWNGTLIVVSADAYFLRCLEHVKCAVLMPEEGKLRRVEGGMDSYLKSFQL